MNAAKRHRPTLFGALDTRFSFRGINIVGAPEQLLIPAARPGGTVGTGLDIFVPLFNSRKVGYCRPAHFSAAVVIATGKRSLKAAACS
jgi:hypothetical protein